MSFKDKEVYRIVMKISHIWFKNQSDFGPWKSWNCSTSTNEAPEKEEPARFNSKQMDFVNMTVSGFICQIPSKKQLEKLT